MTDTIAGKHVVVMGAGPGGYAGAFRAADLGMQVTLIDPAANPGGVCLYRGCIPSKALLHAAKLLEEAREAHRWGIHFGDPRIDLDQLRAWKDSVVAKLTGGLGTLTKARKIRYLQGTAELTGANSLVARPRDGEPETLAFDHAIVATGSSPIAIPGLDHKDPRIMDSTRALELADIPARLLVVGGGYIGLELAAVYGALGSAVTIVEMLPSLIAGADPDIAKLLLGRMARRLKAIRVETKVAGVKDTAEGMLVTFESAEGASSEVFDKILVSVGRRPNSRGLGLEQTRARISERGFVEADEQRRTAEPTLFAIGDVAGNPMLAHKATHEAHVAAEVIAGRKVRFAPQAIPAVVYTDPEVAWVGLTETEARQKGVAFDVASFPWAASGRAQAMDRPDGLTKILADPETRRVLGVGIVGSGAGELIGEGALAVEMGATVEDIALTIHPHPTMTESFMEAAEALMGHSDHFYRPKR